jgi:outer membrane protein assembly factor BamB
MPIRNKLHLVGSIAAFGFLSSALWAARDQSVWPVSRGNVQQTGVGNTALPAKLSELWKFPTGDAIESAVAVDDGVVFVPSMDEHLYAVNLQTGKQKWKFKAGPFKGAPGVKDGVVYAGDLDGILHAVSVANGSRKWKQEIGETGGITFHNEAVLFGSHDANLYSYSKEGKENWKFKAEGEIHGVPAVANGRTFLVGCDSKLHVIDVGKGKEERSVDLGSQTAASAAVLGDYLYVGTMGNEVRAINWKKGEDAWSFKPGRRAQAFYSSPAVAGQLVVIGSRDNRVYAINRKKGTEVWSFPTGGRVDSSPVVAGNRVVVGSLDGKLYILNLANGKEIQQFTLDAPISASPALAGGKIIIGTQKGTLYCFGQKK